MRRENSDEKKNYISSVGSWDICLRTAGKTPGRVSSKKRSRCEP
jgi:hypothetical protein